jgi:MFS family permease
MLRAAIAWQVFAITRSAFHLGLIGLVQFGAALAFGLVGGAVADTAERRRIMIVGQLVPLVCAGALCGVTAAGAARVWILYATVFVASIASAFDGPAQAALLPALVPRHLFPRAVAAAQTNRALAFATGPALGGLVIGETGVAAAYAVAAVLLGVALAAVWGLRTGPAVTEGGRIGWNAIREGLAFVRSQPVVLACMTLDMAAVVFGGAVALLPVYATDILHVGARGYGLLASSLDVGAILCSIVLASAPPITRAGPVLLGTVAAYGVATIVFGLSRWFPLSVAAYMLVGVADQVSVVLRSTTIQLATPDELRGRVSSINLLFIGASNQLGAAESGFLAALTSATFSVVGGGVASILVVIVVAVAFPELRRYRLQLRSITV